MHGLSTIWSKNKLTKRESTEIKRPVKRTCKYPGCHYYDPKSESYCCAACSGDHYDHDRLNFISLKGNGRR